MQRFFTETIESNFIKAILSNSPISIFPPVSDGDYLVKGCRYLYSFSVILCTKSGYLKKGDTPLAEYSILSFSADSIPSKTEYDVFKSTTTNYDSATHHRLGEYLRYVSNTSGVNLMPYYNCFGYEQIHSSIDVGYASESYGDYLYADNPNYKVFAVPIKFNRFYTIAIDSFTPVYLKSVIIDDIGLVANPLEKGVANISDYLLERYPGSTVGHKVLRYSNTLFRRPFLYSISNKIADGFTQDQETLLQQHEKDLYLILQISQTNNSSIVILEGDYRNYCFHPFNVPKDLFLQTGLSELKLLEKNDKYSYAFSDKLIEYLALAVISPADTISENIAKVNKAVLGNVKLSYEYSDDLKKEVFKRVLENRYSDKFDIDGYVDVNAERVIARSDW